MDNKLLHQTLAELEDNLAQIESVRNQVNNVSKKSEDLVFALSKILKTLEKIEKENVLEDFDIKKKVEVIILNFKKDIQSIGDGFLDQNNRLSKEWKSGVELLMTNLKGTEQALAKFEVELRTSEKRISSFDIRRDFDRLFEQFKTELNIFTIAQDENISSLKSQINSGFKDSSNQIQKIDPTRAIVLLEKKVELNTSYIKSLEEKSQSSTEEVKREVKDLREILDSRLNKLTNISLVSFVLFALLITVLFFVFR